MRNKKLKLEGFWLEDGAIPVHDNEPHPMKPHILKKYDELLDQDIFNPHRHNFERLDYLDHVCFYRSAYNCPICRAKEPPFIKNKYGRIDTNNADNLSTIKRLEPSMMTHTEYSYNGWKWLKGYRHCIDIHNIIPSDRFLLDVLDIDIGNFNYGKN